MHAGIYLVPAYFILSSQTQWPRDSLLSFTGVEVDKINITKTKIITLDITR